MDVGLFDNRNLTLLYWSFFFLFLWILNNISDYKLNGCMLNQTRSMIRLTRSLLKKIKNGQRCPKIREQRRAIEIRLRTSYDI